MDAEVYDTVSRNIVCWSSVEDAIRFCEEVVENAAGLVVWTLDADGNLGDKVREYHGPLVTP